MAPQAARVAAPHGHSSLRLALVAKCDLATVSVILRAYPEAAKEVDAESGMTLLHVAVRSYVLESTKLAHSFVSMSNPSVESATAVSVICLLLVSFPRAITVVDKAQLALPVHYARSNAAIEEMLHSAYPEGRRLVPFPSSSSECSSFTFSALEGAKRGKGVGANAPSAQPSSASVHVVAFEEREATARLMKENALIAAIDTQTLLVCMKERRKLAAEVADATNVEAQCDVDTLTGHISLLLERQRKQWER